MHAGVRHASGFRSGNPSAHPSGPPGAALPVAPPAGHRAGRPHLSSMHPALTPPATAAHPLSRLPPRLPSAHRHPSPAIRPQPADAPPARGLFTPGSGPCPREKQGPANPGAAWSRGRTRGLGHRRNSLISGYARADGGRYPRSCRSFPTALTAPASAQGPVDVAPRERNELSLASQTASSGGECRDRALGSVPHRERGRDRPAAIGGAPGRSVRDPPLPGGTCGWG